MLRSPRAPKKAIASSSLGGLSAKDTKKHPPPFERFVNWEIEGFGGWTQMNYEDVGSSTPP